MTSIAIMLLSAATAYAGTVDFREALVDVRVNSVQREFAALVLIDAQGRIWIADTDLLDWGIAKNQLPASGGSSRDGRNYLAAAALAGLSYTYDAKGSTLDLIAQPHLLNGSRISAAANAANAPQLSPAGGFMNYDFGGERSDIGSSFSGLMELGAFRGPVVAVQSWTGRKDVEGSSAIRLDSALTFDLPEKRSSLRIGDGTSTAPAWGRSVRYGGIHFGTDFSIVPHFIPFPMASVAGEATLPSSVDLYINNVLALRQNVAPGPFVLDNVPAATGSGEIRTVVRDVMGRERSFTTPYLTSARLLREGLNDWSVDAGALRENYGLRGNDYGAGFIQGRLRRGLTARVTAEAQSSFTPSVQNYSGSTDILMPVLGLWSSGIAVSDGNSGTGTLIQTGMDRSGSRASFGLQLRHYTRDFRQAGDTDKPPPKWETVARFGIWDLQSGSLGLAGVWRAERQGADVRAVTLNWSQYAYVLGSFAASITKDFAPGGAYSAVAIFTRTFGARNSASWSMNGRGEFTSSLIRGEQTGRGAGFRLDAGYGDNSHLRAGGVVQTDANRFDVEAVKARNDIAYRARTSGALALFGGHMLAAPRLDGGFAAVEVPGAANAIVYRDRLPVARTDSNGRAWITGLRPFETNEISVDPTALPLELALDQFVIDAVPYRRGGVLVKFPSAPAARLVQFVLADGTSVPAAARVTFGGREFPTGTEGTAFLPAISKDGRAVVTWLEGSCRAVVDLRDINPLTSEEEALEVRCE